MQETWAHIVKANARRDRNTVPPPVPVMCSRIAEVCEGSRGKGVIGALGLLKKADVRLVRGQPLLHPLKACPERVHVPRDDSHNEVFALFTV